MYMCVFGCMKLCMHWFDKWTLWTIISISQPRTKLTHSNNHTHIHNSNNWKKLHTNRIRYVNAYEIFIHHTYLWLSDWWMVPLIAPFLLVDCWFHLYCKIMLLLSFVSKQYVLILMFDICSIYLKFSKRFRSISILLYLLFYHNIICIYLKLVLNTITFKSYFHKNDCHANNKAK